MTILKKLVTLILIIIAIILTVMFTIQLFEIFIKDSSFLFFQIILVIVWGTGAIVFWIIGIGIVKSSKRSKQNDDNLN